ncbi:MAG: CvpA family protein [Clostridiales bacterium]|jgi:uncharacterized membrane protein required for colicin V production|nr:CvpA family protein [Clostridiales bacterium]
MSFAAPDIITAVILAVCTFIGWRKGLAQGIFSIVSTALSFYAANAFYPSVSTFLRGTPLFGIVKNLTANSLNLTQYMPSQTLQAQGNLIESLSLPGFLKDALLSNNNVELYKLFNVDAVEDYVTSYIANMCMNVVAVLFVFVAASIAMRLALKALNIVTAMPVIKQINRIGGLLAGALIGVFILWVVMAFATLFCTVPAVAEMLEELPDAPLASFFYRHNMLFDVITAVKA